MGSGNTLLHLISASRGWDVSWINFLGDHGADSDVENNRVWSGFVAEILDLVVMCLVMCFKVSVDGGSWPDGANASSRRGSRCRRSANGQQTSCRAEPDGHAVPACPMKDGEGSELEPGRRGSEPGQEPGIGNC